MKLLKFFTFILTLAVLITPFTDTFARGRVIFVHGFQPEFGEKTPTGDVRKQLEKIFPECEITIWQWSDAYKNVTDFRQSYYAARASEADEFAKFLMKKPPEERENTILVGHSLGGAMVVDAMQRLAENNIKICRGIFLGAAIPSNERDIDIAIRASLKPNINIYNCQDYILKHLASIILDANILGSGGYTKDVRKSEMIQIQVKEYKMPRNLWEYLRWGGVEHDVMQYLSILDTYLKIEKGGKIYKTRNL